MERFEPQITPRQVEILSSNRLDPYDKKWLAKSANLAPLRPAKTLEILASLESQVCRRRAGNTPVGVTSEMGYLSSRTLSLVVPFGT
jgi:hypothetical protein